MSSSRKGEAIDENQLLEQLSEIIPKLMVWAGPEVLNAWKRLSTPSDTPLGPVAAAGNLITALRKELGHSDDSSLGALGALSAMLNHDARKDLSLD